MNPVMKSLYKGEDLPIVLNLGETNFADLSEVIVGVKLEEQLVKTLRKTATGNNQIVVGDAPTKCVARLFRSETATWQIPQPPGKARIFLEVTLRFTDTLFPNGRNETHAFYLCDFEPAATATV